MTESDIKILEIWIPGKPVGKPRQTQSDRWRRRPAVLRYRAWADVARLCAINSGDLPQAGNILSLSWVATFSPPKSWSKRKRVEALGQLHRSKPDRDNIDKSVLDALFESDQAIAAGNIRKEWGLEDGVSVSIEYVVNADIRNKDD